MGISWNVDKKEQKWKKKDTERKAKKGIRRFLILLLVLITAYPCCTWLVVIWDGYAPIELIWLWLGTLAVLVVGVYLTVRFLPEPASGCWIESTAAAVIIGILPYLWNGSVITEVVGVYFDWLDSFMLFFTYPNGVASRRTREAIALLIILIPWNYMLITSLWYLIKILRRGRAERRNRSLCVKGFRLLTAGKSPRRCLLISGWVGLLILGLLAAVGISAGIWSWMWYGNLSEDTLVHSGSAARGIGGAILAAMLILLWIAGAICLGKICAKKSVIGQFEDLQETIHRLSEGEYEIENPIPEGSPLYQTGEELAKMADVLEENVQKAIAGERVKVELITNVSHDLKTPLTAIIGYGERLAKQELSDEAREYVEKLNHKAEYLSGIVQDVFELSKAAGGEMPLQCDRIDIRRLWEQTIGEYDERFRESGLELRRNYVGEEFPVWTDGMRMHRVFSNLLDNALKYALAGTRIYLKVEEMDGKICSTLTNTASYEMEFTAKEITGRFVRGNKARTGEGSGIGLAIAETFVRACGGELAVYVDGDQFRVVIEFARLFEQKKETGTAVRNSEREPERSSE